LQNAEIYKQRRELIQEREKIPIEIPEPGVLFDMRPNEEEAFESAQQELADLEQRLRDFEKNRG